MVGDYIALTAWDVDHYAGMQEAKAVLKLKRIQRVVDDVQTRPEQVFHFKLRSDWLEDTEKRIDDTGLESTFQATWQRFRTGSHLKNSKFYWSAIGTVQTPCENDVFANVRRHSELSKPESFNEKLFWRKADSNGHPDSSNNV
ncbi:hypothetical protein Tco_0893728 [Tanacetum coccineum]|uniref:Uncharacterized protein n=1 Tax=Tanacetum coccineum TaxID=301880 RepID=A0ABQ5CCY1_9ASTR